MKHKKAAVLGILLICILSFGIWTRFHIKTEKIGIKGVNLQRTNAYSFKGISNSAEVKWQQLMPFGLGVKDFIVHKNFLVYATYGEIVVIDKESRAEKWKVSVGNKPGESMSFNYDTNIAISEGTIYYSVLNKVIGLDIRDGKEIWSYENKDAANLVSPVISKGTIYFGSNEGKLYAVDINSKREKWSVKTDSIPFWISLDNNNVYCSDRAKVYSISAGKGQKNWEKTFPSVYNLIIDDKNIYFTYLDPSSNRYMENRAESYKLVSLDKKSGDKVWGKQFDDERVISTDFILYENKLFYTDRVFTFDGTGSIDEAFGKNHEIHALSCKDGSEVWKVDRYDKFITGLAAAGGELYAAVGDKTVRKVSMKDGREISKHKFEYQVMMDPVFEKGRMYFIGINFGERFESASYYIGLME